MPNKMLIDASHPEETRVVVLRGNRIEEFDFESQDKKQLKGNIYLARVTRVEPSLQAAFVEYGGNRHGFLAFSEIHPDYYQIPVADRQALLRAEAEEDDDDDDDEDRGRGNRRRRRGGRNRDRGDDNSASVADTTSENAQSDEDVPGAAEAETSEPLTLEASEDGASISEIEIDALPQSESDPVSEQEQGEPADKPAGDTDEDSSEGGPKSIAAEVEVDVISEKLPEQPAGGDDDGSAVEDAHAGHDDHEHEVESVGAEDALDEVRNRRKPPRRHYKIQEVIKRRQILLVQVVKEERGNKGAALTTYLSLAGRYSVLMPNTARGGGISRKITNAQDRKRLKEVVADLDVPQGMGVILRTAGESRTKAEIKRDYEYLMRLWDNVRELTLKSTAPALVYEEGSLIKRSVRDLYNKDIDEILVSGEEGYREAKDFMRMLMPSHAKVVQPYRETTPLFARFGIEAQLDKMLQPQVTLKSGGYLIINQTEALVSIDVNSGRSTKEHSIEETALHTNLEAAEEVARQLRLRDLAGLIVIDFIDMEENRNNRAVEKRLKDHLKNDRARIQLGRISHFGLMEMSRQRIRASVLESTMKPCPHCGGTGHVRSDSSVALMVVRAIEEFLLKDSRNHIIVKTPTSTALYVLNHKRSTLSELEARFGLTVTIEVDESVGSQHYMIMRGAVAEKPVGFKEQQFLPAPAAEEEDDIIDVEQDGDEVEADQPRHQQNQQRQQSENGEDNNRKRRRRRRRRGGRDRDQNGSQQATDADSSDAIAGTEVTESDEHAVAGIDSDVSENGLDPSEEVSAEPESASDEEGPAKKRRRGKRGGKRNRREDEVGHAEESDTSIDDVDAAPVQTADVEAEEAVAASASSDVKSDAKPEPKKPRRASRAKKAAVAVQEAPASETASISEAEPARVPAAEEPTNFETAAVESQDSKEASTPIVSSASAEGQPEEPASDQPKRGGWWQRRSFF